MSDEVQQSVPEASDEVIKRQEQLDEARKLLFEDEYMPEGVEDIVDQRTGQLKPRDRAMMAFNNLNVFLPGTWGDGSAKSTSDVSDQDFIRDFIEVSHEVGIDLKKVGELNHGEAHSKHQSEGDSIFELYRYVYPAMERLVKEKGYRVYW